MSTGGCPNFTLGQHGQSCPSQGLSDKNVQPTFLGLTSAGVLQNAGVELQISVGPACRAGLRGLPRPVCKCSNEPSYNPKPTPQIVRLAAKVLSGRKDLLRQSNTNTPEKWFLSASLIHFIRWSLRHATLEPNPKPKVSLFGLRVVPKAKSRLIWKVEHEFNRDADSRRLVRIHFVENSITHEVHQHLITIGADLFEITIGGLRNIIDHLIKLQLPLGNGVLDLRLNLLI